MIELATKSADDTREVAATVASVSRGGDLVLLAGELGSGKTAFTQGFGRGLGVREPITSPTFTLMHEYEGRVPLLHVDVYRLDHLQEIVDLGITELVDDDRIAIVEWGDVAEPVLPPDFLEVQLSYGDGDDDRHLRLRAVGSKWSARQSGLRIALDRWVVGP